ncbi:unnamed protein product [Symbiodinium necroappetens]|uniref:Uncharacterized protein n=1 Tax=Symbiodinium necroappetens TaxID=1628268 RepID=A0A813AZA2_9DINO|nr:unnamed protein product [Symbiodinium necroappetens]
MHSNLLPTLKNSHDAQSGIQAPELFKAPLCDLQTDMRKAGNTATGAVAGGLQLLLRQHARPLDADADLDRGIGYASALLVQRPDELLGRWNDKSEGIDKAVLRSSSTPGEVETSGSIDPQAILERLEEHRLADVSEAAAQDGEPEAMLFSLQDMKEELDAFRWITAEVVARRIELEALEQENQAFREEQASLRQRYEDMMEEAELDVREDGAAS